MKYFVRNQEVDLDKIKPFGKGSEGEVYRIDNDVYKIYYPNMLSDSFGNKSSFHQYLIGIPTTQIILPNDLIFDINDKYVGYKAPYINGDLKDKTGIIKMESSKFIKNLKILENDFTTLSKYNVVAADVTPFNFILDNENNTMNIIDPGRYKNNIFGDNKDKCQRQNIKQLDTLIELLMYLDFIKYKVINSKRKQQLLRDYIIKDREDTSYSEYFSDKLNDFENLEEYAKSLGKYIK